jgi:hypothetical protein
MAHLLVLGSERLKLTSSQAFHESLDVKPTNFLLPARLMPERKPWQKSLGS